VTSGSDVDPGQSLGGRSHDHLANVLGLGGCLHGPLEHVLEGVRAGRPCRGAPHQVADDGKLVRFVNGKAEGWDAADVGDEVLRTAPVFTLVTSGAPRREGRAYGYDPDNRRVIAFSKVRGAFDSQFRLGGQSLDWAAIRDWYVEPAVGDGPDALVWLTTSGIRRAVLQAAPGGVQPSSSGGSEAPSGEAGTAPPAP